MTTKTEAQTKDQAATEAANEAQAGRPQRHQPKLLGKPYFQRKKSCPFTGPKAQPIDYKDVRTLSRYTSPFGKLIPAHVTGVSAKAQRRLTQAVKRARTLALMPYTSR